MRQYGLDHVFEVTGDREILDGWGTSVQRRLKVRGKKLDFRIYAYGIENLSRQGIEECLEELRIGAILDSARILGPDFPPGRLIGDT